MNGGLIFLFCIINIPNLLSRLLFCLSICVMLIHITLYRTQSAWRDYMRVRKGFTLIELLIVVAIIGY